MTGFLFILFIFVAAVLLWAARTEVVDFWSRRFKVHKDTPWLPDYWNPVLLGGAVIMLGLAGVMGYGLLRQSKAPAEVSRFIAVYPNVAAAASVPRVGEELHWLFRSDDPPDDIASFYETLAADSGWAMQRSGDQNRVWLQMERGRTEVLVFVTRDGEQSKLTYQIKEREES